MNNKIKFAKMRTDATIPSKRTEDVGYDFYPCFEENNVIVEPLTSKLIPTGIATAFSEDYGLIFRERGSTGVKNIKVNAGVIDSGYRGEIFVSIYNANTKPLLITKETNTKELEDDFIVYPYSKAIVQGVLIHVPKLTVEEVTYDELFQISSERGDGKIGSSHK